MWGIRIISGPQAGQVFSLKGGRLKIGRAPSCQIQIQGNGVSKEHAEITAVGNKVTFSDLQSSNGSFLNGVRVNGAVLKLGDKLLIGQTMFDVVVLQKRPGISSRALAPVQGQLPASQAGMSYPPVAQQGQYLPSQFDPSEAGAPAPAPPADFGAVMQEQVGKVTEFVERVAMPGVYRLPEVFEFRYVILGFVAVYSLILTLLSLIPLNIITSESISIESQRRALSVARSLASVNERVLRSGQFAEFRTDTIMKEEGIEDAYVISKDGKILAPPERVGLSPKQAGFTAKIRASLREATDTTLDGRVVASVPIVSFDAELQQNIPRAHAVVVYNPGNLQFDEGRVLSLFVQMLTLALVAGFLLYFMVYKLVEHPYRVLLRELDESLRDGRDSINIPLRFPALQDLMVSLNSLLVRVAQGATSSQVMVGKGSRDTEIANIMTLIGYPSLLVSSELKISRVSPGFEALTGIAAEKILNAGVGEIPDPAMQQNISHLVGQAQMDLSTIFSDHLEISGHMFTLNCQALCNAGGEIEYYLITVTPMQEEGAA